MTSLVRLAVLVLLLTAACLCLPNHRLAAQGSAAGDSEEAPTAFVPSEKLPADAAVSFPVDI